MAKASKSSKSSSSKFLKYRKVNLSYKQTLSALLFFGILLFGLSGYTYYKQVFTDPNRVLSDMLSKSLQVDSIQRNILQTGEQSSVDQVYFNTFTPHTAMQSRVVLREGDLSSGKVTKVTNETVGTSSQDFVRYTSIDLPEGNDGKDFSKVLEVWGKREKDEKTGAAPTFLNESIFSVVPFGDLSRLQRSAVIDEANSVNVYDFKSSKVSFVGGRPVMTYSIPLKPESLLKVLSKYAQVTGYGDKDQLDPEQYKDAQPINIVLTVDLMSRHVRSVKFSDTQRLEKYGAYGIQREITTPSESISIDELQSRLQQFQ